MRMTRHVLAMAVLLIVLAVPVDTLFAENNETPTWPYGWQIQPFVFQDGDAPEMKEAAERQGYVISYYSNSVVDLIPDISIADVEDEYGSYAGVGMIWTHGNPYGQAIEIYPYTLVGMAVRDGQFELYEQDGYAGKIYKGEVPSVSYHIGIWYYGAVDEWTNLSNAIIDNECCYGGTFNGWNGARVWFGAPGGATTPQIKANVTALWEGLDGIRGKDKRAAGQACLDAPALTMGGNGNTTLAPVVEDYHPQEGYGIGRDSVNAWIVFDTKMDIGILAEGLIRGDGNVVVKDEHWVRGAKDTLRFTLKSVIEDDCCATLSYETRSYGDIALDGNQDPPGTDGEGPNRDDYVMCYDCQYTDPNVAAALGSQWAYIDGGDVQVGWHVEAEWETREYLVEAGAGEHWEEVGRVARGVVVAPDVYSLTVGAGYDLYRIVEIDKRDKRSAFRPMSFGEQAPPFVANLLNATERLYGDGSLIELSDSPCNLSGHGKPLGAGSLGTEVPDWVFYGPDSLLAECGPAVSWFESNGYSVDLGYATSAYY